MNKCSGGYWVAVIPGVALVVASAVWLIRSNQAKILAAIEPKVLFASVDIREIGETELDMLVHLVLVNRVPVRLTTDSLYYELRMNGTPVVRGKYSNRLVFPAGDTSSFSLPVTVEHAALTRAMDRLGDSDSASYQITASFDAGLPLNDDKRVVLRREVRLPVFRLVTMKPRELHVRKWSLRRPEAVVDVVFENPNSFPVKMKDVVYRMQIGDAMRVKGSIPGLTVVPPGGGKTVACSMKVEKMNLPKTIWKTLFDKKDTPFTMRLESRIVSGNKLINDRPIVFSASGNLHELKALSRDDQ